MLKTKVWGLLGSLWLGAPLRAQSAAGSDSAGRFTLRVDAARHAVILRAGPFRLERAAGSDPGGGMHEHTWAAAPARFTWPVDGWVRGMKLRVLDGDGRPLPRGLVRHLVVINLGRGQLFYPQAERLMAMTAEAEDLRLPATIGIPVSATMPMMMLIAWKNVTADPIPSATAEVIVQMTSPQMVPRPISVFPVPLSVINPVGHAGDFDLPAGPTRWTADFDLPLSGRILAAGGHLHDHGTGFELQEITPDASRTILRLRTKLSPEGRLLAVDRVLPGAAGDGLELRQGRRYRLVATYLNPTGNTLAKGAMANLILLFSPDRAEAWPALPASHPDYRKDLAYLESFARKSSP